VDGVPRLDVVSVEGFAILQDAPAVDQPLTVFGDLGVFLLWKGGGEREGLSRRYLVLRVGGVFVRAWRGGGRSVGMKGHMPPCPFTALPSITARCCGCGTR
jgi:hypothetical protein